MAIAVFGMLLVWSFNPRIDAALDRLELPAAVRASIDRELPKLAGAESDGVESGQGAAVRRAIDEAFVSSFGLVMTTAAMVAFAAAAAGWLTRR